MTTNQLAATILRDLGSLAAAARHAYKIAQADGADANDYRLAGDLLMEQHGKYLAEVSRLPGHHIVEGDLGSVPM